MKDFEEVDECKTVEEFNLFVQEYLDERGLKGEARRKTYWALFYRWKARFEQQQ